MNRREQARVAASAASAAEAVVTAVDATAPAADVGEAAAIARPLMPVAVQHFAVNDSVPKKSPKLISTQE